MTHQQLQQRIETLREVLNDLEHQLQATPVEDETPSFGARTASGSRRRPEGTPMAIAVG